MQTLAQVRSEACKALKQRPTLKHALIYKDAGGSYQYDILQPGKTICYLSFKGVLTIDNGGKPSFDCSRENMQRVLLSYPLHLIYAKFD